MSQAPQREQQQGSGKRKREMQPELLPIRPKPQSDAQHSLLPVTIREICEQRNRFNIDPQYQRDDVWTIKESQQLIDTILQGHSIGVLEGFKYFADGQGRWEILNGHQRISTIQGFYDDAFKTWSATVKRRIQPTTRKGPVEPGRFFHELTDESRDYFLDYTMYISRTPETAPEERATRFLCIQCQKSLTPAEKLGVFPSKANAAAFDLAKHSFWEDFYIGAHNRKQLYQSSLSLIALTLAPEGMADLSIPTSTTNLTLLASGKFDSAITDNVVSTLQERLDAISMLYDGMHFTERVVSVAMYQSVIILEQAGVTITSSHKGRLTKWLTGLIDASKHVSGLPAFRRPLQRLNYKKGQKEFWAVHKKTILNLFGVKDQDATQ